MTATASAQVRVKGYYRKDGTYVAPHERTKPNQYKFDNYSYRSPPDADMLRYQAEIEEAQAARQRDINRARSELITNAYVRAYPQLTPEQAALMAAQAGAQGPLNLKALGMTPRDMQDYALRQQALNALKPTLGEGQAALAALAGKPVEVTKITGNTAYSPYKPIGEQEMQVTSYGRALIDARLTFHGYVCIDDCSGHEAGYAWAEDKGITDPDDCGGNSQSFIEGCRAYAEEQ